MPTDARQLVIDIDSLIGRTIVRLDRGEGEVLEIEFERGLIVRVRSVANGRSMLSISKMPRAD